MKTSKEQTLFFALALVLVFVLAVVVGGCGGGSSSSSGDAASSGSSSAGATLESSAEGSEAVTAEVRTEDPVSEGSAAVEIEPRRIPIGKDNDEISPTGAKPIRPCRLVTRKEATAILGKGTKVAERPQGPTCVYSNAGRTVTLSVEVNSVKQLRSEAQRSTKVDVDGKTGWCIKYQSTSVIVGVSEGRVLRANGPCQAGARFVSKALRRL